MTDNTAVLQKRVDKPDARAKDLKVNELEAQIEKFKKEREVVEKSQVRTREMNKPFQEKRKVLIDKVKGLRKAQRVHLDAMKSIREKLDRLQSSKEKEQKKEKALRESLKFKDVGQVDRKISELETYMQRTVHGLKEEKDILRQIQQLRTTRKKLSDLESSKKTPEDGTESLPVLKENLKKEKAGADKYRKDIEKVDKELDELSAQNSEADSKDKELKEKYIKLSEKIKKLVEEKREVIKKWTAENDAYYEHMRAYRKAKDEQRKAEEEEQKRLREEEEKRLEEEEMKKKPWEEEIALCDFLVNYLEGLSSQPAQDSVEPPVAQENKPKELDGLTAVGKKVNEESDFLKMGGDSGSKKKRGKKKSNNVKGDQTGRLVHSLDLITSFSHLELTAPVKSDDIAASIQSLKEKRAYYDVLPRAPKKPKDVEQPAQPKSKGKKGKQGAAPSTDNVDLFPVLPGSKTPSTVVSAPTGPSAVDLVKSSGSSS